MSVWGSGENNENCQGRDWGNVTEHVPCIPETLGSIPATVWPQDEPMGHVLLNVLKWQRMRKYFCGLYHFREEIYSLVVSEKSAQWHEVWQETGEKGAYRRAGQEQQRGQNIPRPAEPGVNWECLEEENWSVWGRQLCESRDAQDTQQHSLGKDCENQKPDRDRAIKEKPEGRQ